MAKEVKPWADALEMISQPCQELFKENPSLLIHMEEIFSKLLPSYMKSGRLPSYVQLKSQRYTDGTTPFCIFIQKIFKILIEGGDKHGGPVP